MSVPTRVLITMPEFMCPRSRVAATRPTLIPIGMLTNARCQIVNLRQFRIMPSMNDRVAIDARTNS